MAVRGKEPLTALEADKRDKEARKAAIAAAQRKSAAYSRLIRNEDFKELLGNFHKRIQSLHETILPMSEFEQGRKSAWLTMCEELSYASGGAKLIADLETAAIEAQHRAEVFPVEQCFTEN